MNFDVNMLNLKFAQLLNKIFFNIFILYLLTSYTC